MLYSLIMSMAMAFAFTLPLMFTPVTLGVWIFLLALMTASLVTFFTSSWFGLILFIIYVGGMLVMFSYFVATAPNQKLSLILPFSLFLLIFMISFLLFLSNPSLLFLSPSLMAPSIHNSFAFLYLPKNIPSLIFLASLLLLALILVVKVASRKAGPLRPFN
uniref:NADH dehydrogenase subunit 6 n=1 Tax=Loimia medusa TaxID=167822 RepID=UPI0031F41919